MKKLPFPLFLSFMLFLGWFHLNRSRMSRKERNLQDTFWERENRANSTRKKSLDGLPYITIPLQELPVSSNSGNAASDSELASIEKELLELSQKKIVNFTGITNTELKLQYGAPNLDVLTQYDENFTCLCRLLFSWGKKLDALSRQTEAIQVLEYGVRIGTDIRGHYLLLADLYKKTQAPQKIQSLIDRAEALDSLNKNGIIRGLIALQTGNFLSEDGHTEV
jgi:hypothetical protein